MDKSAYMLRISQANPTQLVVINFELILEFLATASASACAVGTDEFTAKVQKVKNGLEQLIYTLDFNVPLAHDFYEIYKYTYMRLSDISFTKDETLAKEVLAEATETMDALLVGWQAAAETEAANAEPVATEAPKVYTGLTYGKGGQAEEYIEDSGRGFMA